MDNWKEGNIRGALFMAGLAGILLAAGCGGSTPKYHYPDSKAAATQALKQNNVTNVSVSQDRAKGVMVLTGTMPNRTAKLQAEEDVRKAAPKYTIANEIAVAPSSSAAPAVSPADIAIQDRFNDAVKKHHYLADDQINAKATKGDVVLSGTVRTKFDRREAERLAKAIPGVHKVQNNLTVQSDRG